MREQGGTSTRYAGRRAQPGRKADLAARLLEAALEALRSGGETGLRVQDVGRAAGCSVSAIYQKFGSREGLVEAALVEQLHQAGAEATEALEEATQFHLAAENIVDALMAHSARVTGPDGAANRALLVDLLSASRLRPELLQRLQEQQKDILQRTTFLLEALRQRGQLRANLDPAAVALFLREIELGRVVADVLEPATEYPLWLPILRAFLEQVFSDRGVADSPLDIPAPSPEGITIAPVRHLSPSEQKTLRDKLLAAAVHEIEDRGVAGMRVRRIANEAGCSTQVLYRHFDNRDGLLAEVALTRWRASMFAMGSLFEGFGRPMMEAGPDAGALWNRLLAALGPAGAAHRRAFCDVLAASRTRPDIRLQVVRELGPMGQRLSTGVLLLQQVGVLRPDLDAGVIALLLRGLTFGRILPESGIGDEVPFEAWTQVLLCLVRSILRSPTDSVAPLPA